MGISFNQMKMLALYSQVRPRVGTRGPNEISVIRGIRCLSESGTNRELY